MARHRRRRRVSGRVLLVSLSGVLVAVAAGTAGAAVVGDELVGDAVPTQDATTFFAAEGAATTDLTQAEQERAEAGAQAVREVDAASLSEPEEDSDSGGDADLEPTGEGGTCEASNYWEPQPTASGEQFDPTAMTAAHRSLPFDTMVEVTNTANGRSVTVRINDRGPYIDGRCLDLARGAFEEIADAGQGVATVEWRIVA